MLEVIYLQTDVAESCCFIHKDNHCPALYLEQLGHIMASLGPLFLKIFFSSLPPSFHNTHFNYDRPFMLFLKTLRLHLSYIYIYFYIYIFSLFLCQVFLTFVYFIMNKNKHFFKWLRIFYYRVSVRILYYLIKLLAFPCTFKKLVHSFTLKIFIFIPYLFYLQNMYVYIYTEVTIFLTYVFKLIIFLYEFFVLHSTQKGLFHL